MPNILDYTGRQSAGSFVTSSTANASSTSIPITTNTGWITASTLPSDYRVDFPWKYMPHVGITATTGSFTWIASTSNRVAPNYAEERAKRWQANERAELLLLSLLTEEQATQLKARNCFTVQASSGIWYQIRRGRQHNILRLASDRKTALEELCVHVKPNIPDADNMAAQLLWLRTNEPKLREVANIWDLRSDRQRIHASAVA